MVNPLIGIHAGLGELGALLFLWVFVELLNPTEKRIKRAQLVALLGVIFIFLSWITGGYYYVEFYGSLVKPIIKEGPTPWAHSVVTETKEHVFLFLPFLSILAYGLIGKLKTKIAKDRKLRVSILTLVGLIVLVALSMAAMGYVISSGFRSALEVMNL